jgi:hypothetical protein
MAAARRELAAGRSDSALALARELLVAAADDPEALHLNGLIEAYGGRYSQEAIR